MARVSPILAEALNWVGLTSQPSWQAIILMGGSGVLAMR